LKGRKGSDIAEKKGEEDKFGPQSLEATIPPYSIKLITTILFQPRLQMCKNRLGVILLENN